MTESRFFPEALAEYEDAVVYYETCESGLGARLIREIDAATALAMEFPEARPLLKGVPHEHGLRSMLLRSFPIKLVYAVRKDALVIVAVFHAHRRPGYWIDRLGRLGRDSRGR